MATVTGYTAERMQIIEDEAIVDGAIVGGNLHLIRHDTTVIDAGSVIGPAGPPGPAGATGIAIVTSGTRPTGGARFDGLLIYETDTKRYYSWDGTVWVYRGGTIICTSVTRPSSPFEGLEIYETDTDKMYIYNGTAWIDELSLGAWTSFTPTLTQGGAVTKTVDYAKYMKVGRLVHVNVLTTCTGAGTIGNIVVIGLPLAAATSPPGLPFGSFLVRDSSTGQSFPGMAELYTSMSTLVGVGYAQTNYFGSDGFTVALAAGDSVGYSIIYEAAA